MSLGPPNYTMQETYKSRLDREPPKSSLSKGCRGFLLPPPPPRECDVLEGGSFLSGACVGAVSGVVPCGRAVGEKEIM
jgi:hypothetical protein